MILKNLSLLNFRNYGKCSIRFGNGMNIFVGDNAQGKTNILESIYILALTKSHRNGTDSNLIQFHKELAKIKGTIKVDRIMKDMEIDISKTSKKVFLNQTEIRKISDYISNLNVIVFTPDDLEIIKGSPNIRRNLLNIQISQISYHYLKTYNEYNKILRTRNEYLKLLYINHISDPTYFHILTDQLIEKATYIYQKRKEYIDQINMQIGDIYQNITGFSGLQIKYEPNIELQEYSVEEIKNKLKKKFQDNYKREQMQGMTLYGPHRDEMIYQLNQLDLKLYGSQGQQKIAVIAYKLSEVSIFYEHTKTKPILLLDDIFSEIDTKKKNRLLTYINQDIQSIITTTDLKNIKKSVLKDASVFEIKNGKIAKKVGKENG